MISRKLPNFYNTRTHTNIIQNTKNEQTGDKKLIPNSYFEKEFVVQQYCKKQQSDRQ